MAEEVRMAVKTSGTTAVKRRVAPRRAGRPLRRSARALKITVPPGASVGLPDGLIKEITTKIVKNFNPCRVVLFGSRVLGTARPDSDIDLFVEMESRLDRHERAAKIDELFDGRKWSMDLIVYTPREVIRNRGMVGFIMDEIEETGYTLYAQVETKR